MEALGNFVAQLHAFENSTPMMKTAVVSVVTLIIVAVIIHGIVRLFFTQGPNSGMMMMANYVVGIAVTVVVFVLTDTWTLAGVTITISWILFMTLRQMAFGKDNATLT